MKYVLDSSVAVKWVLSEQLSDKGQLLRDDFRNGLHILLAPDFFPIEIGHALTRAERQKRIPVGGSLVLLADALSTSPIFHSSLPYLKRSCEISSQMRVGIYDCSYVAKAEQEKCELLSADDKLLKNLQSAFPCIVSLASLP